MMYDPSHICLISLFGILVRWSLSLNLYSGAGKPPMFGDFEAQRHWMEITANLPVSEWYVNGTDNDLLYWGLDYPPLTAYHSWICGNVAMYLNSSWVALGSSRGIEDVPSKLFMRYTALLADVLIYLPAVFAYFAVQKHMSAVEKFQAALVMLLYPGLILIDHGHFQFNSVSLGLTLWGVVGLNSGHDLLGSIAFVLALNYKQMSLYHSIPFFCYLLGSAFKGRENWFLKLFKLGIVVIGTFALCWLPFLHDKELALQVLRRVFPFNRGIYEDKVANFWCSLSVLVKIKNIFTADKLVMLCLGTTLVGLLPSALHLLRRPTLTTFKIALINASLVFFMFSYHTHEKSILLPALPVCLLLPLQPFVCTWFLVISTFSMLPLLIRDVLLMPTIATTLLFFIVARIIYWDSTPSDLQNKITCRGFNIVGQTIWNVLMYCSLLGCVGLGVASVCLQPPKHLPDLFPVLIACYSALHFAIFLLYFHWLQFTHSTNDSTQKLDRNNMPVTSESKNTSENKVLARSKPDKVAEKAHATAAKDVKTQGKNKSKSGKKKKQ